MRLDWYIGRLHIVLSFYRSPVIELGAKCYLKMPVHAFLFFVVYYGVQLSVFYPCYSDG